MSVHGHLDDAAQGMRRGNPPAGAGGVARGSPDRLGPHATIVVPEREQPALDAGQVRAVRRLAETLRARDRPLSDNVFERMNVRSGAADGPAVFVEDHSAIALSGQGIPLAFEHRIRLLAGTGDTVLVSHRHRAFEAYCRDVVGLASPDTLVVPVRDDGALGVTARAASDPRVLAGLARRAGEAGGLTVFPYLASGDAWRLASGIAERAGVVVHVAAAPPALTARANDKTWFSECVGALLGPRALIAGASAFGAAALAARLRALARRHPRVVVKVPASASGTGNVTIDSHALRGLPLREIRDRTLAALRARGWGNGYPVLVSVWECAAVASPSVQAWIPLAEEGAPRIEGVFDQLLQGPRGEFVGARPSRLGRRLQDRLRLEALLLASLLQHLGYFGRVSFDALITRPGPGRSGVHWVDCNARWGGVSLPLTLANRLTGDGLRGGLVVVQHARPGTGPMAFDTLLTGIEPALYRPGRPGGVVLTNPGCEERDGLVDFVALAPTQRSARRIADAVVATVGQSTFASSALLPQSLLA